MKREAVITITYDDEKHLPTAYPEYPLTVLDAVRYGDCPTCDTHVIYRYVHAPLLISVVSGDVTETRCPCCHGIMEVTTSRVEKSPS